MSYAIIGVLLAAVVVLLISGTSGKLFSLMVKGSIRVVLAVFLLFLFNVVGALAGLHIPINASTAVLVGILGIPGIASLAAIQYFIL
ncbi:inhibitor of the pro-sigma K processing machinery [Terribacillus halophilus]|uniref:Inhibitor of the pro-sigma K processing machinery n=1 Tax=Terribacillus halophilus TaxID=361279 RepID=A0A1G6M3T7_9BACI|nr:pro-sigmaK processing inhibitor BofA family protein [Terribacillus halophilus]SDC49974.1 inhibitor of the pro-sigma K processing machinery [Terribacillus halophilus]